MNRKTVISSARLVAVTGAAIAIGVAGIIGCQKKAAPEAKTAAGLSVTKSFYGVTPEGDSISQYTMTNGSGMEVKLIDYGATVTSIVVPDRDGTLEDVTLGYDSLSGHIGGTSYLGVSVGRYSNRIGKAQFTLDGETYNVTKNDGDNHLHGGAKGFHKVVWSSEPFSTADSVGVTLTYFSKDGEEGFPGNMNVTNVFTLKADASLTNVMSATSDKKTVASFTHHSYFNLTGNAKRDILDHELMIAADTYTPVDEGLIPTGKIEPLQGTALDFSEPTKVGLRIDKVPGGYDHNYIVNKKGDGVELAARMYEPVSGRVLEVLSNEPAIQFYSGNFLDGTIVGKGGKAYPKYYAFCLEPEKYPDSPNKPEFPTCVINPGETYRNVMVFKFSTK